MRMTDIRFSDCLTMLRENSKLILIVLLASCVTSFLGAEMLMDGDYWSEAEIQVLYGTGSSTERQNSDRSAILVRERMTPDFLKKVITDNGLYPQDQRIGSLAEALKAMERNISTSVVEDDVVRLAFRASDPKLAQRVTSQLASQCETANRVSSQENLVLSDLTGAIKKAETDLAKQEGRVEDFNLRFLGSHLEKQTATLATLNRLILQLQSNADLLNALQEQKSSQERLLTQESQRLSEPIVHPDSNLPQASQADSLVQSNPSSLSFAERQIKIDQFNREIDKRKRQQTEIHKEMAAYQSKIDSTPQVRSLQSWITRDYDKAKLHYQEL